MAKVLFLHGSGTSYANSNKRWRLASAGHTVEGCPDLSYPDDLTAFQRIDAPEHSRSWFEEAVRIAQAAYDKYQPQVIVGSSWGGAVVMNLCSGDTPQVLVGPAWTVLGTVRFGQVVAVKPATVVVHGDKDWLVFPGSSRLLLQRSQPQAPEDIAKIARLEERLVTRFSGSGAGLQVEGRLLRVGGDGHPCNSEPAIHALLGSVEVLAELAVPQHPIR